MSTAWLDVVSARPPAPDAQAIVTEIASALLEQGCPTAPHVVAKLARRLDNDLRSVCESVGLLSVEQRCGHRALPRMLPVTPSIAEVFEPLVWQRDEKYLLLLAAVATVARLDVLVEATGASAESIASGTSGLYLKVRHGRFDFIDPRLAVWLLRTADPVDTVRAHRRLQQVHAARGERLLADWHRARGAWLRTPEVVSALLAEARNLSEHGHPEWGYQVAAEAADHAVTDDQAEAHLIAGAAMVGAGCIRDGADWLGRLFPHGSRAHRDDALSSVFIAEACLHGTVPVIDPAEHRPRTADVEQWHAWARTAGLAASLCAERGERSAMRLWLSELREADNRSGVAGAIRDPVVALCWMLTGEAESSESIGAGPFCGGVIGALRAALDGDVAEGLRIVSRARAGLVSEVDLLVAGFENSPLVEAYLLVTEGLLLFWRGDVEAARTLLLSAMIDLPIGLPFAGLGSTLAHRLDIAVLGTPGVLARSLAETLPSGIRVDRFVDTAITAYVRGGKEKAMRMLTLWIDRGAPEHPLTVPGLDGIGPLDHNAHVEPPEQACARALRRRIRLLPKVSWQKEHADIAMTSRSLVSPFERARVEAMLGSADIVRGEVDSGRRHLQSAQSLFEDSGALAWRDEVSARVRRLAEQTAFDASALALPSAPISGGDPLSASRSAWAPLLTERELEVAMRVIEGLPNREIAQRLEVSVRTVEVHAGRIFAKLGVRNRVQLTVLAHRTARHF